MAKFTDNILVPMEPAMAAELRRRASQDQRPTAAYVRILLAAALARETAGGR